MKKLYFFIYCLLILILFDIFAKKIFSSYFETSSFCYDKDLLYNYCPDSKHEKIVNNKKIITNIDEFSISYSKNYEKITPVESKIILIGDSFIQADELIFEDRIVNYFLKENIKTIQIGYGSWNPFQYENIFEKFKFSDDATFLIFLMSNDFFPNYKHSYLNTLDTIDNYKKKFTNQRINQNTLKYKIKKYLKANSFLVATLAKINFKLSQKNLENEKKLIYIEESHTFENSFDCSFLKKYKNKINSNLYDNLVFSKNKSCWEKKYFNETDEIIKSLQRLENNLKTNQRVLYFLVTPGWAYENENTIGKKMYGYNLDQNILITQIGLSDYLKDKLKSNFYDTEKFFTDLKKKYPEQNSLYLDTDGHWTKTSHFEIYNWIKTKLPDK